MIIQGIDDEAQMEEPELEDEEIQTTPEDEDVEIDHGRHLRSRKTHLRKGGRKGKHAHSRKLEESDSKSKAELLKELYELKAKIAANQLKLKAEEKLI